MLPDKEFLGTWSRLYWVAGTVVPLLDSCLKERLDYLTLETRVSIAVALTPFNHYSAKRMPSEYGGVCTALKQQLSLGVSRIQQIPITSPRACQPSCWANPFSWSILSAVLLTNAASALYINFMARALGTSCGRSSWASWHLSDDSSRCSLCLLLGHVEDVSIWKIHP